MQCSSFLLVTFGREVHLLCHFMSQSSSKQLFLLKELRRRKRGKKLLRSYAGTLFRGGEEMLKNFGFLHFLIYYSDESSLPAALF